MIRRSQKYEHRLHYLHGRMRVVVLFMTVLLLASCPVAFVYIHEKADRIPPTTVGNVSDSTATPKWYVRNANDPNDPWDVIENPSALQRYTHAINITALSDTVGARVQYAVGEGVFPERDSKVFEDESDFETFGESNSEGTYTAYAWAPLRTVSAYTTISFAIGELRTPKPGFSHAAGLKEAPLPLKLIPNRPDEDTLYYTFATSDTNRDGNINEDDVVEPTDAIAPYIAETEINILGTDTTYCIKVLATREGWRDSTITSACYVKSGDGRTALRFNPAPGNYNSTIQIALSSFDLPDLNVPGVALYYEYASTDSGSLTLADVDVPMTSSAPYEGLIDAPIIFTETDGINIYCLKVIAVEDGITIDRAGGCYYRSLAPLPDWTFTLNADNANPRGIWSDGERMWVVNDDPDKLFAYSMSTGNYERDFNLDPLNATPRSLYSDGTTIWVDDVAARRTEGNNPQLFAYGGAGDSIGDFISRVDLAVDGAADRATGIASNDTTLWVVYYQTAGGDSMARAYSIGEMGVLTRNTSQDITLRGTGTTNNVEDIWVNNDTMWVLTQETTIHAYKLSTRLSDTTQDIDISATLFNDAVGIWSDGNIMWIVDDLPGSDSDMIRAYNMPPTYAPSP